MAKIIYYSQRKEMFFRILRVKIELNLLIKTKKRPEIPAFHIIMLNVLFKISIRNA